MAKPKGVKKENLGKYFLFGTGVAVAIFIIFSFLRKDEPGQVEPVHIWSAEMDSAFVKDCFNKYKPQIKDEIQQQQTMKAFCRCILSKMKTKYGEDQVNRMTDLEIKQWDAECRNELLNPNNLLIK